MPLYSRGSTKALLAKVMHIVLPFHLVFPVMVYGMHLFRPDSVFRDIKLLRQLEFLPHFFFQIRRHGQEFFTFDRCVANEKRTCNDLLQPPVLVKYSSVQFHAEHFSFLVADDGTVSDAWIRCILKGHIFFNISLV